MWRCRCWVDREDGVACPVCGPHRIVKEPDHGKVTPESIEAWENRDLDHEEDISMAITRAVAEKPDTMAWVASRLNQSYHDVERRFSPLIRKGVLTKGRPGDTKENPSGAKARVIYPGEHAEAFMAGNVFLPELKAAPSKGDLQSTALARARSVAQVRDVRDGLVLVPVDAMVALSVALDRLEES